MFDNIIAISTPPGNGGVSIIRISGFDIKKELVDFIKPLEKFLKQKPNTILPYKLYFEDEILDEVLISYFKAPHSFTGEDIIEINTHGGFFLTNKILKILISNTNLRLAQNGEFTKRAFLNNKLELTKAEAINAIINANSDLEVKSGILQLEGELFKIINKIKNEIINMLQMFQIDIDFVEHIDIDIDKDELLDRILNIIDQIKNIINLSENYDILHKGFEILFLGQPNAGKSSLINRIIGKDEIIVHQREGTTRDIIEKYIKLHDILVKLVDTAGLRHTNDEIELIGISKSKERIKNADLILYIIDGVNKEKSSEDINFINELKDLPLVVVINKIDMGKNIAIDLSNFDVLEVSAKSGQNIDKLKDFLYKKLKEQNDISDKLFYISNRQIFIIKEISRILEDVKIHIENDYPSEVISALLKEVLDNLNRVTGEVKDIDIINEIFENFCIGK